MPGDVRLIAPMVMDIRGTMADVDDQSVEWSVGYAPEIDEEGDRFVITRMLVEAAGVSVTVEVAATAMDDGFGDLGDAGQARRFETALSESVSLALLWDMARIIGKTLSGTLDAGLDIPLMPPSPVFSQLVRPASDDDPGDMTTSLPRDHG